MKHKLVLEAVLFRRAETTDSHARAVYGLPPVLILDEPNANLDSDGEAALFKTLEALKNDGHTIVVVSQAALLAVVDKVIILKDVSSSDKVKG